MDAPTNQQTTRYALIIGAAALLCALATVFLVWRSQGFVRILDDAYGYGAIAERFLTQGYAVNGNLTRREASLYPLLMSVVFALTGSSHLVVKILHAFLFSGTCMLVFAIGNRLFNLRTGLLAGLFCAFNPMFLRYIADLHMETVLTFAVTLSIWCSVRFVQRPTVANGVLFGVVGMLTSLTKPVLFPYLFVFGLYWLWRQFQRHRHAPAQPLRWQPVAAMFACIGVILAAWSLSNTRAAGGRFVLIAPGFSDSFLRGYIFTRTEFITLRLPPYTYAENECNNWFRQIARDAGTVWERDEIVDEKNNMRVVKEMVRTQPVATLRKCVVGLFTFWYQMTSRTNSAVAGGLALLAWALAFVGWRRARREGRETWMLFLPIFTMNLFVAALISLGRYSIPILPCLLILAAFGVDSLLPHPEKPVTRSESA